MIPDFRTRIAIQDDGRSEAAGRVLHKKENLPKEIEVTLHKMVRGPEFPSDASTLRISVVIVRAHTENVAFPVASRVTRREPLLSARNGIRNDKRSSGLRTSYSSVRPQGVDDLQAREVLFVFGDNHAMIRFSDCGNDHVEGAPGPPLCRAVGHQPRPDQGSLCVEREHSAGE